MTDAFSGLFQRVSDSPLIFDSGDHPNGTIGSTEPTGLLATSGNVRLWDPAGNAQVFNKHFCGFGTSYLTARNAATLGGTPVPLTSIGGVFSFQGTTGTGMPMCMFGRDETGSGLDNLTPHINFGSQQYYISQRIGGGAFVMLAAGSWKGGELSFNQSYQISCDYDYTNNKTTVFLPDGTVLTLPSQCSTTLPPDGCWEIVNVTSVPDFSSWSKVWLGKSDAFDFRALTSSASQSDFTDLKTAVSQLRNSKTGATSGPIDLISFTSPSVQGDFELLLDVTAAVLSGTLPGCCMTYRRYGIGITSNGATNVVSSIRSLDTDLCNPAWTGIVVDFTLLPSIIGSVIKITCTPSVTGANAGYVTGLQWSATGHDVGLSGGFWSKL